MLEDALREEMAVADARSERPRASRTLEDNERLHRAASRAEEGCLRTAARLLRGDKVLPPCEATTAAILDLYATQAVDVAVTGPQECPAAGARDTAKPHHCRRAIVGMAVNAFARWAASW